MHKHNITHNNITHIYPVAQLIGDEGRYGFNPLLFWVPKEVTSNVSIPLVGPWVGSVPGWVLPYDHRHWGFYIGHWVSKIFYNASSHSANTPPSILHFCIFTSLVNPTRWPNSKPDWFVDSLVFNLIWALEWIRKSHNLKWEGEV